MQQLFSRLWFRILIGLIALVGTIAMASYQRRTGPTYPVSVEEALAGSSIEGELIRTHGGEGDARVALTVESDDVQAELVWRRYPTGEAWTRQEMVREDSELAAYLPHQAAAAKLEYSVRLWSGQNELTLPHGETAIIRFRSEVPAWVLIPHILCMFVTLWIVFRAAIGALLGEHNTVRYLPWILGVLVIGGFFLGPLVQKYAFDAWWTGWPFGGDWTDNKTLAALIAWVIAWLVSRFRPRLHRVAIVLATVVMVVVYLIPHSIHGSELDWDEMDAAQSQPADT